AATLMNFAWAGLGDLMAGRPWSAPEEPGPEEPGPGEPGQEEPAPAAERAPQEEPASVVQAAG
ncbi:TetR family transcriptional regulator, partial [Streptomyces rubrogriseus]|nr:TetR family transcriptional regulator [Streptomyces rubrogriseus]